MEFSQTSPENSTGTDCVEIEIPFNLIKYLSSENCDIQKLCRICLTTESKKMYPIYYNNFNERTETLPQMFASFTAISVLANDGLPTQVCGLCKKKIMSCYEFKSKCVKADTTLKSFLKGEFETKDEEGQVKVDIDSEIKTEQNNAVKAEEYEIKLESVEDLNAVTDVEYLEDMNDIIDDTETLCIEQDINKGEIEKSGVVTNSNLNEENKLLKPKPSKKSKSHSCSFCFKRFANPKALKAHINRIHNDAKHPFSCRQCKDSFNSEHDLRLHMSLHNKGPMWKCVECNKEFSGKSMLRRHIQRHMQSKRYSCEVCGKPFTELYALRRHSRVHTGERVEKRHACHICDKRYSESSQLTAHIARHSGERPCICATCGKSFPSPRLLASHHLVHSDAKPYACSFCDKRFRHESTRNTHHRTHTGEKPYVCSICGKTFIQNSNLTLHMRTHTGEKPYACKTCGRNFSSGSSLKSHVRSHTGEKPFSCSVCGKKFARMDISAHMRQHTGERPFPCSVCARKFTRASRLRDHYRIHTGEKPFECAMCTLKFSTKSHLVKHVKTHQSKKKLEREVLIVRRVDCNQPYVVTDKYVITRNENDESKLAKENVTADTEEDKCKKAMNNEIPLEEIVLQDDSAMKTDLLEVDDNQANSNFQNGLCLSTNGVNFVNNDMNYANDVNLVTVNEGEVSISSSSAMLEGTTVKLYRLDQSLVQIHSVGGQVTISKITSKMTANF